MSQLGPHHPHNHHHHHHHHHHNHRLAEPHAARSTGQAQAAHRAPAGASQGPAASGSPNSASAGNSNNATGKRGHQRRQSVARLLPDISKLRLLSWLVEASSELINCDIAIMDGVYAKLNRSRESLLFWHPPAAAAAANPRNQHQPALQLPARQQRPARPAPPVRQPVPNRLVLQQRRPNTAAAAARLSQPTDDHRHHYHPSNHHSLPVVSSSYGSSSDAGTSSSLLLLAGSSSSSSRPAGKADSLPQQAPASNTVTCDTGTTNENKKRPCDSNQPNAATLDDKTADDENLELISNQLDDDDDDSSSASSGIHANSLSSSVSSSGSISSSGASSTSPDQPQTTSLPPQVPPSPHRHAVSSAEELREKIIRTVMEHQHLQNLLVNIIRQHDKRRQQLQLQRRRQMSFDSTCPSQGAQQRIDLADIADALDDGCLCTCHSVQQQHPSSQQAVKGSATDSAAAGNKERSSTLPPTSKHLSQQVATAGSSFAIRSPVRSKTVGRGGSSGSAQKKGSRGSESQQLPGVTDSNHQDIINLMSDRLCENCFETHHWLHGCLLYNASHPATGTPTTGGGSGKSGRSATVNDTSSLQASNQNHLNAIISNRNANFIKLVQQQVRATISKSIELIDLIRKEIKLPESIKQKQLMRCFSASIQLLTSVGNYVVPAQDISTFLPEVGGQNYQQQASVLFSLPPSDFDNIHYLQQMAQHSPSFPMHPTAHHQHHLAFSSQAATGELHYHLAAAPEIPLRRGITTTTTTTAATDPIAATCASLKESPAASKPNVNQLEAGGGHRPLSMPPASSGLPADQVTAPDTPQKLKTLNEVKQATVAGGSANESSSGASSNNSSASSSIARGAVQQSSLLRAAEAVQHSSGPGAGTLSDSAGSKTSHGLSFDTVASLSRNQQHQQAAHHHHHQATGDDDDLLFLQQQASRSSKFWQSSKFNFIKKLLHVRQQRLLRQQSKDRKIYNNKVQNKFRLVMMDLTHFNKSQQLLATENGVNSLLTSMRNVLEFGLYLTLKLY